MKKIVHLLKTSMAKIRGHDVDRGKVLLLPKLPLSQPLYNMMQHVKSNILRWDQH